MLNKNEWTDYANDQEITVCSDCAIKILKELAESVIMKKQLDSCNTLFGSNHCKSDVLIIKLNDPVKLKYALNRCSFTHWKFSNDARRKLVRTIKQNYRIDFRSNLV